MPELIKNICKVSSTAKLLLKTATKPRSSFLSFSPLFYKLRRLYAGDCCCERGTPIHPVSQRDNSDSAAASQVMPTSLRSKNSRGVEDKKKKKKQTSGETTFMPLFFKSLRSLDSKILSPVTCLKAPPAAFSPKWLRALCKIVRCKYSCCTDKI